ncbi:tetrahydromethanopterin:alpha-L-glutamate ligase (H(4)MPT:alpha-L-glutamate ligase), putative [Stigmatella aurantiaca DW4/3-1]|uniref:Tetrahydromethanopterin:alpha-L-glutamate ligase (H(4)MPT:alpha-L-glutamate ligase), putative n=1 Tax=Stigmatella aurantiaca (strain DW4/3-1) TaxID=378806 RepID=Q095N8_STIAD|nr:tetrahydromethanopterin:alpha-L-glutamate ligase (H(4)MPT:alpha-L-glutamate ligase), putative [Stigmatella aurantiaca DW4/3-1]
MLYHMNADEQNSFQNDILRLLELSGVGVVNDWASFSACKDKPTANLLLHKHGINVPPSLLLSNEVTFSQLQARLAGWKGIVFKPRRNHGGKGIMKFDDVETLWDFILATRDFMDSYYLEKFIEFGLHDYRVEIFDGQVVGGYSRQRTHRFKTNITQGGKMLPVVPTEEQKRLAQAASRAMGVTTTIVDMICSETDGKLYVLEVNPIMGIFVEAGMRARMPGLKPAPEYSNDEQKLTLIADHLDARCREIREKRRTGAKH